MARVTRLRKFDRFYKDVAAGKLPQFTALEPNYGTSSEENPDDVQVGERFIAKVVHALMHAPTWRSTALFITYDEHGGYYDHVPPPPAVAPDSIPPMRGPRDVPGTYDSYGFRVPLIVVSPWARKGYVSRVVQDHTSLLAFVERKWNLPAMTLRDANADPMLGYFDFRRPTFARPPALRRRPRARPRPGPLPRGRPPPAAPDLTPRRVTPRASRSGATAHESRRADRRSTSDMRVVDFRSPSTKIGHARS